jgi:phosphoribosylglycinamide formyltransferase-1
MGVKPLNLAILVSGRGSNMEALLDVCADPAFPARASVVISNRPDAGALAKAAGRGIKTEIVDHRLFPNRTAFEAALQVALDRYPVDLICLAGFMRLLGADFVNSWHDRIINIHPSLLPAYKGLDTHARVLADGGTETGCTVHFVRPAMDDGPVIVQKKLAIQPGDTPDTLAARVLTLEHQAYPEAIRLIAEGKIAVRNEKAVLP